MFFCGEQEKLGGLFLKNNKKIIPEPSKLKIIPLGGLEQIGMNITAFEYEDSIIVVDCGLSFPADDMLGIDLVIPDMSYLLDNKDNVSLQETYNDVKFLYYKRSSTLSYGNDKPITFGLYFSYKNVIYTDVQKKDNSKLISE